MLNIVPCDVLIVSTQRLGGGFGGKQLQSINTAPLASFSFIATARPCWVALDWQVTFNIIGNEYGGLYKVAVSSDDTSMCHCQSLVV